MRRSLATRRHRPARLALCLAGLLVASGLLPPALGGARATAAPPLAVVVWGDNSDGEYGDGTATTAADYWYPRAVPGLSEPITVRSGASFNFAITADPSHPGAAGNELWAWGANFDGVLGAPSTHRCVTYYTQPEPCNLRPTRVLGEGGAGELTGVTDIATNGRLSLALLATGAVESWGCELGAGSSTGQLGNDSGVQPIVDQHGNLVGYCRGYPMPVQGLSDVASVAVGDYYCLAVKRDGTVWAWGLNAGYLGSGSVSPPSSAVPVAVQSADGSGPLQGVEAVSAGFDGYLDDNPMAIQRDPAQPGTPASNRLVTWGNDVNGVFRPTPVLDASGKPFLGVVSIAVDGPQVLAARSDGTVWNWGWYVYGDGNAANYKPTPRQVLGPGGSGFLRGATAVFGPPDGHAAGGALVAGPGGSSDVYLWGNNIDGQLTRDPSTTHDDPFAYVTGSRYPLPAVGLRSTTEVSMLNGGSIAIALPPPPPPPPPPSATAEAATPPPGPPPAGGPAAPALPASSVQPGGVPVTVQAPQPGVSGAPPGGAGAMAPGGQPVATVANPVSAALGHAVQAPFAGAVPGAAALPGPAQAPGSGSASAAPPPADSSHESAQEYAMLRHEDGGGVAAFLGLTGAATGALVACLSIMGRGRRRPTPGPAECRAVAVAGDGAGEPRDDGER